MSNLGPSWTSAIKRPGVEVTGKLNLTYGQVTTLVGAVLAVGGGVALAVVQHGANDYSVGLVTLGLGALLGNTANNTVKP